MSDILTVPLLDKLGHPIGSAQVDPDAPFKTAVEISFVPEHVSRILSMWGAIVGFSVTFKNRTVESVTAIFEHQEDATRNAIGEVVTAMDEAIAREEREGNSHKANRKTIDDVVAAMDERIARENGGNFTGILENMNQQDFLGAVLDERRRQLENLQYTLEDDLRNGGAEYLIQLAIEYASRGKFVKATALNQAALDSMKFVEKQKKDTNPERTFHSELQHLLNKYSIDNDTKTPDFILVEFVLQSIATYQQSVTSREKWLGNDE